MKATLRIADRKLFTEVFRSGISRRPFRLLMMSKSEELNLKTGYFGFPWRKSFLRAGKEKKSASSKVRSVGSAPPDPTENNARKYVNEVKDW